MKKTFSILIFFLSIKLSASSPPEPYCSIRPLEFKITRELFDEISDLIKHLPTSEQALIFLNPGNGESCIEYFRQIPPSRRVIALSRWNLEHFNIEPDRTYYQFLSNILHLGLTQCVWPIRMNSIEMVNAYNIKPQVVFIDEKYTPHLSKEIEFWLEKIADEGFVCGSGASSRYSELFQVIKKLSLPVLIHNNFWLLKKSK